MKSVNIVIKSVEFKRIMKKIYTDLYLKKLNTELSSYLLKMKNNAHTQKKVTDIILFLDNIF